MSFCSAKETLIYDSFIQLSDIVRAAASGCPNWVTTLLGWKKDEKGSRNIEM
jgi:hypothetical protein